MRSNDEPGFSNTASPPDPSLRVIDLTSQVLHFAPVGLAEEALRSRYVDISQKHRDLDDTIERLREAGERDELLIARLKKRKLQTRDEIIQLERQLQHVANLAFQGRPGHHS